MSSRQKSVSTSSSGYRSKSKYSYKPYYRKSNTKVSSRSSRQKASSSNLDAQRKRVGLTTRSFYDDSGVTSAHDKQVIGSYTSGRRPSVGIFGAERGAMKNITLQRRLEDIKPKGDVPAWLSETFGHLPRKHPLRARAVDPIGDDSAFQDGDNPFAFQPPSPSVSQAPTLAYDTPPMLNFPPKNPVHSSRAPICRRNLSSIRLAPPTFVEPTHEDRYEDTTMPLNDDGCYFDRQNSAYFPVDDDTLDRSPGATPPILRGFTPVPRFPSPQQFPSPLFLPDIRLASGSPTFDSALLDNTSSDDFTLPTPTHDSISFATPRKDQIKDVLRDNHPFVTSMYASSPAGSFRGFPLGALVGGRDSSPYTYPGLKMSPTTCEPNLVHTPLPSLFQNPGRLVRDTHTTIQARPASSDIYKAKLLAYATTMVDHMNSSEDESWMYDPKKAAEREPKIPAPIPENDPSSTFVRLRAVKESTADARPSSFEYPGYGLEEVRGTMKDPLVARQDCDGNVTDGSNLAERLALVDDRQPTHALDTIPETAPERNNPDEELLDADIDGLDPADNWFVEDWESKSHSESVEDDLEEAGALVSEYEIMQAEYDMLAADEPSDEEMGTTTESIGVARTRKEIDCSALGLADVPVVSASDPESRKPNPRIQPFPMKVSSRPNNHRLPPETADLSEGKPTLTRLSPKFDPRSVKRVRPSPFAALLKRRLGVEEKPEVGGVDTQNNTADSDDDIELWPG